MKPGRYPGRDVRVAHDLRTPRKARLVANLDYTKVRGGPEGNNSWAGVQGTFVRSFRTDEMGGRWYDVGEERAIGCQSENHRTSWGCAHFRRLLESRGIELRGTKLLVVGSGDGSEAAYFAAQGSTVSALDPSPEASDLDDLGLEFYRGPLEDQPFRERPFDLVFCYHVLEHMQQPRLALMLMHDSLAPRGLLYLGTPNRLRALGYLGSKDTTTAQKVRWNLADWRSRLLGRFRNELGAHAGFSRQELRQMALERFATVEDVTLDYLHMKYSAAPQLAVRVLTLHPAVVDHVSPAVYMLCQKRWLASSDEAVPPRDADVYRK